MLEFDFKVNRKEPLADLVERIAAAFADAGLPQPVLHFTFADSPFGDAVSPVGKAIKRFPELSPFLQSEPPCCLSNAGMPSQSIDPATLEAILGGIPRSFPFHHVLLAFRSPLFGEPQAQTGLFVADSWRFTGRTRSLTALTSVEKSSLEPLFAHFGTAKTKPYLPLPDPRSAGPEVLDAVRSAATAYKSRMPEILERIPFPHDLPPSTDALRATPRGEATGSKKPSLTKAFGHMGYDCTAKPGTFTLQRRTPSGLNLEISLDVGTWNRSITALFIVHGPGFRAGVQMPVSRRSGLGQYSIGDAATWRKIVENLAVFVQELETNFVPSIETASGLSTYFDLS